jgi:DNA-directed RNA polymerase subunit omega
MARITVEDCLKKINNRFALIHMASKRVRELRKGEEPSITSKNRDIVVSLREIAAGNISIAEPSGDKQIPEILIQAQVEPADKLDSEDENIKEDHESIEEVEGDQ